MSRPIVITGGGTGGHIFPMLAVAQALEAKGIAKKDIRFVGSRRGQEKVLLANKGYELTLLSGRGIRRSFTPEAIVKNIGAVSGLVGALLRAVVSVGVWRPRCVVSVGGYASLPASLGAVLWRRPLVLLELDVKSGAAHRLVERFAAKRCTSFPTQAKNAVFTGAPIRTEIANIDRSPSARLSVKKSFNPPLDQSRHTLVVMTGSLGSTTVNRAVLKLADMWRSRSDLSLIHVTGTRDFALVSAQKPASEGLDYRVVEFGDMVQLWAVADIAVCRAGAATLAELTALGIPSVLVPLPGMNDHQLFNAQVLEKAGAAVLVRDDECTAEALASLIDDMLLTGRAESLGQSALSLGHRSAADEIASAIFEVIR
jgi:UDP-N-acetylglucosamine--N-acetylmuramyl-(pentapeptide) pyrophosphoryl-undecaprenol N-acetylglucosamine transferase